MNTPRTDAIEVCAYYADDMRHMIVSAEDYVAMTELSQQLETEVQELRAALEECARVLSDLPSTKQLGTRTNAAFAIAHSTLAKVPK